MAPWSSRGSRLPYRSRWTSPCCRTAGSELAIRLSACQRIRCGAAHHATGDVGKWLTGAASSFAAERGYLTRLIVLAGPEPSTPGQADSIQTVVAQAHALTMLAKSDRAGTALGAAVALILDWRAIRAVLDNAASRLGIDPPPLDLPDETSSRAILAVADDGLPAERAMQFGAQQLLLQHRGLWDLLEARRDARDS